MKSRNKEVRKAIEESAPIFKAVRRASFPIAIRSVMHRKGLVNRDIAERLNVTEKKVARWLDYREDETNAKKSRDDLVAGDFVWDSDIVAYRVKRVKKYKR